MLKFKGRQRTAAGGLTTRSCSSSTRSRRSPLGASAVFERRRRGTRTICSLVSGKQRALADAVDSVLHAERLDGKAKRTYRLSLDLLPDGAIIAPSGSESRLRR